MILAWGGNDFGELGIGKVSRGSRIPVAVRLGAGRIAVHIGTGWDSSNALAITRSRR
jgi:regulator of chromosome condensation (RCC1) repeat-containing protein